MSAKVKPSVVGRGDLENLIELVILYIMLIHNIWEGHFFIILQ